VRVMVFSDRPDALLILAAEDESEVRLPSPLAVPFVKTEVAMAFGDAKTKANVFESVAGRWTAALTKARRDERAERAQQQAVREATEATLMKGSSSKLVRSHAEAIAKKLEVDESIRVLTRQDKEARSRAATRGVYESPKVFREREARLASLRLESQALQARMGELRKQEKRQNLLLAIEGRDWFKKAAHELLDGDLFAQVESLASEMAEQEEPLAAEGRV
jgi:hypothetical protein